MSRYPRLRDETERILTTFLREQEQKCKDHVSRGHEKGGEGEGCNSFTSLG